MRQCQPDWKKLIAVLVGVSAVTVVGVFRALGIITWTELWLGLGKISLVTLIVGLLWEWFRKHGWRTRLAQKWSTESPDISGEWFGFATSTRPDTPAIPIEMTVGQTYTSIVIRAKTADDTSRSHSIVAGLLHDTDCERHRLVYTYVNEPTPLRRELDMHFGTAILDIYGKPAERLSGQYLTAREPQTKGTLELYRSREAAQAHQRPVAAPVAGG